jgi:hypothetical protein
LQATKRLLVQYAASNPQQNRYYPDRTNTGFLDVSGFVFGGFCMVVGGYYLIASFVRKK